MTGQQDGPRHPLQGSIQRRSVLKGALAAGVAAPTLSAFLAACGTKTKAGATVKIPSPTNPVTWPLSKANQAIDSGLTPKPGSTLRIYNYADYVSPRFLKDFEAKYGVKIRLSTFNDADEALTKVASKDLKFDLYFPSYDSLGKLVGADLLRPLNHDYLTNYDNLWPSFHDPWYDRGARYTIPYTIYTTGIGWRTDMVDTDIPSLGNPYDVLWDTKYAGNMAILDDWHTAMSMVLLRNHMANINSTKQSDLDMIRTQLLDLRQTMRPKVTISMYTDMPAGQYGLCQMWSGDAINTPYYLPKNVDPSVMRYWFPQDGKGEIDNDLVVCLAQGENPVAAHVFLNEILDNDVAAKNFGFTGYQPPLNKFTPSKLVADGYLPKTLATAVVEPSDFKTGYPLLQLPPASDSAWHEVWQEFKAGG
jgi:spermidine/putrescine transport system substrate-binding protein